MGYLVYAIGRRRLVFVQIVWLPDAERTRAIGDDALAEALARLAFRTTAARLDAGDYEAGGVYVEQIRDWAFQLTGPDGETGHKSRS